MVQNSTQKLLYMSIKTHEYTKNSSDLYNSYLMVAISQPPIVIPYSTNTRWRKKARAWCWSHHWREDDKSWFYIYLFSSIYRYCCGFGSLSISNRNFFPGPPMSHYQVSYHHSFACYHALHYSPLIILSRSQRIFIYIYLNMKRTNT